MAGEPAQQVRRTVYFSGRVQGVGFRYTTVQVAAGFRVAGYVRNLPDGRVELVAEGAPPELDRFLTAVQQAMSGCIREVAITESPATAEFRSFTISR